MKEHLQVKEFSNYSANNEERANEFLLKIGKRVVSVTPFYNTILGGVGYVITYWN